MTPAQRTFVDLLVEYQVIRFGEFTLKSGRKSPYFINAGQLRTGDAIGRLGAAYAEAIVERGLGCDLVFGPAYKGIPLAVATAVALADKGRDVGFGFDRKEAKDHGEGGVFVGTAPSDGARVVIVDDVITSGRSVREAAELVRGAAAVQLSGVIIAVDRQERGQTRRSTLEELQDDLRAPVVPIVSIRELVADLAARPVGGTMVLDDAQRAAVDDYLAEHAAGR